jgi:Flp pilus assembly pilin Flp
LLPVSKAKPERRRRRTRLTDERGAALVEFALVVPLLMLLLLGMFDFGKAFTMWIDETHIANASARYAAVNSWTDSLGAKHPVESTPDLSAFEGAMEADGDTEQLRKSFADPLRPDNGVKVCFPTGTGQIGDSVRVEVKATYNFLGFLTGIVPSLSGDKPLTAHSVMRIEHAYDPAVAADPVNACP